jgi:hypothetical protein
LSRLAPMVITGDQHYTYMFMYPNILFMYYNQIVLNKISSSSSNVIIFHPYQRNLNYQVNIRIFDWKDKKYISLERKEYIKEFY